ncbi:MAG: NADH oxidase [Alphaproteobacteria bacterium ADurb.Bin438]|nr:MAG: NADH oxidase [Alphaproteobacteria bacterium ADurb.Bin438]
MKKGIKAKSVTVIDAYRPEFMPTHEKVMFKVVYNEETRVIIGAQLLSEIDLTQVINAMSVCIQNKVKVEDLAFMDFFFQPHFNKPWSFINLVGLEVLKENS